MKCISKLNITCIIFSERLSELSLILLLMGLENAKERSQLCVQNAQNRFLLRLRGSKVSLCMKLHRIHLHIHVHQPLSGIHPTAIGNQQLSISTENSSFDRFRRLKKQLFSLNKRRRRRNKKNCLMCLREGINYEKLGNFVSRNSFRYFLILNGSEAHCFGKNSVVKVIK